MRSLLLICNYNNGLEISEVLTDFSEKHPKEDTIIIDDHSTDNSWEIAKVAGFKVIRHDKNLGAGAALRTGLKYALAAKIYGSVIIIASNGKMKAKDLAGMLEPIHRGEADFVQGSRYLPGGTSPGLTLFRRMAIPAYTILASFFLKKKFSDVTCGYRSMRIELVRDLEKNLDQEWLNRYELETYLLYLVCRNGYRLIERSVTMDYTHLLATRKSHMKPLTSWWSVFRPLLLVRLGLRK